MINWKRYAQNKALNLKRNLNQRGTDYKLVDDIMRETNVKNNLQRELDDLRHAKKTLSGKWKTVADKQVLQAEIVALSTKINTYEAEINAKTKWIADANLQLPNYVSTDTPFGTDEVNNIVVDHWKDVKKTQVPSHEIILTNLKMIEKQQTVAMCGSRFVSYMNQGSILKRNIIHFLLQQNHLAGYTEYDLPVLVNKQACYGTGQLPKFQDDLYAVGLSQALISTSEISLVNFWNNHLFAEQELPIKMTAFSPCFRKEAGAAGKDAAGLIRLHQFHKVEIVRLEKPENSEEALQEMLQHGEKLLQLLGLPYRVVQLCSGDLGFSATKTYDLEVWMTHSQQYREIASLSECLDFQALRANIKFKNKTTKRNEYVYTLNGSALAVDRLIAALTEYYYDPLTQNVQWPSVLQAYFSH